MLISVFCVYIWFLIIMTIGQISLTSPEVKWFNSLLLEAVWVSGQSMREQLQFNWCNLHTCLYEPWLEFMQDHPPTPTTFPIITQNTRTVNVLSLQVTVTHFSNMILVLDEGNTQELFCQLHYCVIISGVPSSHHHHSSSSIQPMDGRCYSVQLTGDNRKTPDALCALLS